MRNRNGKKVKSGYGSGRGLSTDPARENLPIMSVQCPMPGGTSVTMQNDPVQKVVWGPVSRVEASGHAQDLVKQLRQAVKAAKKSKAKGKNNRHDKERESGGDETGKPTKSPKSKETVGQIVNATAETATTEDSNTPDTASIADTEATNDNPLGNPTLRGFLRAPPATPGEGIFHGSPDSAAAMSMPTLPTMHHIADMKLVETFRLQHAKNPWAFEKETFAIKQGLIGAKVKRGGLAFLLREEYTVELASREGAEIAEKWAKGQARSREHPGLRSRGNSLNSQPSTGSLRIRGGEADEEPASTTTAKKAIVLPNARPSAIFGTVTTGNSTSDVYHLLPAINMPAPQSSPASSAAGADDDIDVPALEHPDPITEVDEATTGKPVKTETKKARKEETKPKLSIKDIKKALSRLNIAENVTKVTTYGAVRYQSSVKREASDHGEKRTVNTWIEITEVYSVPAPQKLTVKDIATAIEQEEQESYGAIEDEWVSDDSDSDSDPGEKEIARKKKGKGKGKAKESSRRDSASSDTSSTSTDSDNDGTTDNSSVHSAGKGNYRDSNETGPGSLLHSLFRLGESVSDENLTRIGNDMGALIAGLDGNGMLNGSVEGTEHIGW